MGALPRHRRHRGNRRRALPSLQDPLTADASPKSDKVDSEALATLLRPRALPTTVAPDARTRALRRVVRDRVFYRKQPKAVANPTYALRLGKGIPYEEGILGLPRRREELAALRFPEVDRPEKGERTGSSDPLFQ